MSQASPQDIAEEWWSAIDRADFTAAAALLAPGTSVDWPLSNERMAGADAWRAVNEHYPGRWRATIEAMVAEGDTVVTRTRVHDGGICVLAISWFTIVDGAITSLVEYWPETYAAPGWRARWVQPMTV